MDDKNNTTSPITQEGVIIAYTGLYTMALASIVYGAILSARLAKKMRDDKKSMENSITFKDAKWFPVTASCVLFGLYCVFKRKECLKFVLKLFLAVKSYFPARLGDTVEKFLILASSNQTALNSTNVTYHEDANVIHEILDSFSKENVTWALMVFFCIQGVFALTHMFRPLVKKMLESLPVFLQTHLIGKKIFHYRLSYTKSPVEPVNHDDVEEDEDQDPQNRKQFFDIKFDNFDLVTLLLCSIVGVWHVAQRHWISNNAFGLAFTIFGIEELHLSSFKAGAVLLAGLFVYDIFWVFATDVMSTVATSVNAPILLMFPQDLTTASIFSTTPAKCAMLGLGDIVIPGVFLALLLRFGQQNGRKSYFYVTIGAYALGLMLTIFVMHYFKAAQPALLYLVPACLGAPLFLAAVRGELHALINYDEVDLVKPEKKKLNAVDKKTN